jgi:hypothetical protein
MLRRSGSCRGRFITAAATATRVATRPGILVASVDMSWRTALQQAMMISKTSLHDMGAAPVDPETVIAAAIIESVAKTAWKNGVNVQDANGGPGSCFGRNKGCAVQAQRRHVSMRYPAAPSRPCIRWTP